MSDLKHAQLKRIREIIDPNFTGVQVTNPTNFHYNVAMGDISDCVTWNKFGYNDDVDVSTSPEILASFGGIFTPLKIASTLSIVSSSAQDSATGSGAISLVLTGIDGNYATQEELISLTGTTPVVTTSTWVGINRAAIYLSGSGDVNAGTLDITAVTGGAIQAQLPAGQGTSQQIMFYTQAGHTALADWLFLNAQKISGSNPVVTIKGWVYSAVSQSKYEVLRLTIDTQAESTIQLNPSQPFVIGEKSCFWIEVFTTTNNTVVTGRLSLIECAN